MNAINSTYRCPHCGTTVAVEPGASDQILTCPSQNCRKPFRVETLVAEPAAQLIMPADLKAPSEPAAATRVPVEAEQELQVVHLDMVRRYPLLCLGYVALAVGGISLSIWATITGWWFLALIGLAMLGFAGYRLAVWWLRTRNTTLRVTNKRFIVETGLLSKQTTEIPLDHIADVQVLHEPFTELLQVGDLVVSTKNGDNKRFVLMAVPHPEQVAAQFRRDHSVALDATTGVSRS